MELHKCGGWCKWEVSKLVFKRFLSSSLGLRQWDRKSCIGTDIPDTKEVYLFGFWSDSIWHCNLASVAAGVAAGATKGPAKGTAAPQPLVVAEQVQKALKKVLDSCHGWCAQHALHLLH